MACRVAELDGRALCERGAGNFSAVQAGWAESQSRLPWEGAVTSTIVQPLLGPPPEGRMVA